MSSTVKPLAVSQEEPFHNFRMGDAYAARPSYHSSPIPLPAEPEGAEFGAEPVVV